MNKKLTISIVGKSGHAGHLIDILKRKEGIDLEFVYYPKRCDDSNLPVTSNFNDLLGSEAIIIASPTDTHAYYLNQLKSYEGYILVEKPIFSSEEETEEFRKWPIHKKEKIKVNYNFRYSRITKVIEEICSAQSFGEPIAFYIHTSHGLAYKENYLKSWRSRPERSFGVVELVGSHFINLSMYLFGEILNSNIRTLNIYKNIQIDTSPDTTIINLEMEKGIIVNLFHSYAGPKFNKILLIGTNGFLDYDGKTIKFYSPRDSFDQKGRFDNPPLVFSIEQKHEAIWQESLEESLDHFIEVARTKNKFQMKELEQSLDTMKPIFRLKYADDR
ncbi:MAG TPA: Gfo/Idh/MocA family oxidoreductase [Candidatus Methylomirabilis sp.]|nr:Gfo/Idh/MocA family oxidoreductase [Candidatus Methylomirabilis sp.]